MEKGQEVRAKSINRSTENLLSCSILPPNENLNLMPVTVSLFNSIYQLVAILRAEWGKMILQTDDTP